MVENPTYIFSQGNNFNTQLHNAFLKMKDHHNTELSVKMHSRYELFSSQIFNILENYFDINRIAQKL